MGLLLGIDSGGSRTAAVLADGDGRELARAGGPSIKLLHVAPDVAGQCLDALLGQLQQNAGRDLAAVTSTCAGLSGYGAEWLRSTVTAMLQARVPGRLRVCGDEEIALAAARDPQQPDAPVILLIAGTGSNCIGVSGGASASAGGWGPALGDEGGGAWIGREALRLALRAFDHAGRATPGALLQALMAAWQVTSVQQLVAAAHAPSADFASLVPAVARAEAAQDSTAYEALRAAGEELARLVHTVAEQLRLADMEVHWTGSILREVPAMRRTTQRGLDKSLFCGLNLAGAETDPLAGAIRLAMEP